MTHTTQCTRCKPSKPCLSHSFIPFDATAWIDIDDPFWNRCPERRFHDKLPKAVLFLKEPIINRTFQGWKIRDGEGRPVSQPQEALLRRMSSGLPGLARRPGVAQAGIFKDRLFAYMRHPIIQKELDQLFPDQDDLDGHQPLFIHDPYNTCRCKVNDTHRDRWHGQIRHKEEPEPTPDDEPAMTVTRAWETVADFMDLDLDALDIGEALEMMYWIKRAVKRIEFDLQHVKTTVLKPVARQVDQRKYLIHNVITKTDSLDRVRAKYRAVRSMVRRAQLPKFDYRPELRIDGELAGIKHRPSPRPDRTEPLPPKQPLVINKACKPWRLHGRPMTVKRFD